MAKSDNIDRWLEQISQSATSKSSTTPRAASTESAAAAPSASQSEDPATLKPLSELVSLQELKRGRLSPLVTLFGKTVERFLYEADLNIMSFLTGKHTLQIDKRNLCFFSII